MLVLLDLSAAFDTIDHPILLHRLEHIFGIKGKSLAWVASYFANRSQTVCIRNEQSDPVLMRYSVPQGSVLGPKFYVMYTKPVGAICAKHGLGHHFYADDSQLYFSFNTADRISQVDTTDRFKHCLNDIESWMKCNMLKLNADKTEVILFTSKNNEKIISDVPIGVGGTITKPSKYVRNLGVMLDSRMTMEKHVNSVSRSCFMQLRQIGRIRPYLSVDATKSVVNSLVTSRLDYCNALLHGIPKTTLHKLQSVQNTAVRIITKTPRRNHITPLLKELHWLPVQRRIDFKILTVAFKAVHGQSPAYIKGMLNLYKPARDLRSGYTMTLIVPKCRTKTYGDRSFVNAAPKLWNALPFEVRNAASLSNFKKLLKTHLFRMTYIT